jgi:hypothetical protein
VQGTVGGLTDDGNCLLRNLSLPWKAMDIRMMRRAEEWGICMRTVIHSVNLWKEKLYCLQYQDFCWNVNQHYTNHKRI